MFFTLEPLQHFLRNVPAETVYPSADDLLDHAIRWHIAQTAEWRCTYTGRFFDSGVVHYYTPNIEGDVRVALAHAVEAMGCTLQGLVTEAGLTAGQARQVVGDDG
jgi:hypothetical protein